MTLATMIRKSSTLRLYAHKFLEWVYPLAEQIVIRSRKPTPRVLDISLGRQRYPVNPGAPESVSLILVGCGGTGSWAAHILAQFTRWSLDQGVDTRLTFIDPDKVEVKNLIRQNFCPAEIGLAKAFTLAWRYSAALGIEIKYFVEPFSQALLERCAPQTFHRGGTITIVVGAVDNYCARRDIADALTGILNQPRYDSRRQYWWLDAGNELWSGQVVIGNSLKAQPQLSPMGYCMQLPFPHIQEPTLVMDRERLNTPCPAEVPGNLSCAELTALGNQSAMINRTMATWIGIYLSRLLRERNLDIHATYTNILTGVTQSSPISHGETVSVAAFSAATPQQAQIPPPLDDEVLTRQVCPECGEGQLVAGDDRLHGMMVTVHFCDTCDYRDYRCPECDGPLAQEEFEGEDGQETVVHCEDCDWGRRVENEDLPPGYCQGPEATDGETTGTAIADAPEEGGEA